MGEHHAWPCLCTTLQLPRTAFAQDFQFSLDSLRSRLVTCFYPLCFYGPINRATLWVLTSAPTSFGGSLPPGSPLVCSFEPHSSLLTSQPQLELVFWHLRITQPDSVSWLTRSPCPCRSILVLLPMNQRTTSSHVHSLKTIHPYQEGSARSLAPLLTFLVVREAKARAS